MAIVPSDIPSHEQIDDYNPRTFLAQLFFGKNSRYSTASGELAPRDVYSADIVALEESDTFARHGHGSNLPLRSALVRRCQDFQMPEFTLL